MKLLGTGGTIASRLDYRTGAVIPAFSPGELYGSVPELADICNLETEKLYGVFSENMGPEQWIGTAQAIGREIEKGVQGIVIGHGTDTMHHTAAILSFMVQNTPVPIVMVGSQRSSDRPSSDAALNLMHSVKTAAESDIAETMVCMFGPTSDVYGLLHRGTRVRKMHSSYRSTFRTIGDIPLAMVSREYIRPLRQDYHRRRADRNVTINTAFEDRVSIVYYYPNMKPDIIESLVDNNYRGIVIAGTGLGHVNKPLYPSLKRAQQKGIAVYMTVQTLWGYVQMYVYDTGRDMMELGVIPGANMLPEVAYMKLGLGAGADHRRAEGAGDHDDAGRRRDHRTGTEQRLPHLPGRDPGGRRVHLTLQTLGAALFDLRPGVLERDRPVEHRRSRPRVLDIGTEVSHPLELEAAAGLQPSPSIGSSLHPVRTFSDSGLMKSRNDFPSGISFGSSLTNRRS